MRNMIKLYAAFKAGYLGENLFDTYFSFFANIIKNKDLNIINDVDLAKAFEDEYGIKLPLFFVRQVLSVGVQKKCFIEIHGRYNVEKKALLDFQFENISFSRHWEELKRQFLNYCNNIEMEMHESELEDYILNILDNTDDLILLSSDIDNETNNLKGYAWFSFVKEQAEQKTELYEFIVAVSASNILREALFFSSDTKPDYSDLHVYLDSPIIFALLGMDEEPRTTSYQLLVKNMLDVGCNLHVLDHNFQEIEGILSGAAAWAESTRYDIRKANNAARFFHDSNMTSQEITEFCVNLEKRLLDYKISIQSTNYDIYQHQFQEDENILFDMIQGRYREHGYELTSEKEQTIRVDVRSIVMIYRERRGQTANRIQKAKHLMLTSNNAIANVSKLYESNKSNNSGHIPACVSADIFGAILWLNTPLNMMEYQKQKLLADCYKLLRPNQQLLDRYIHSLDEARKSDEIDEKKFLFLRSHRAVLSSLMNVTKGDYARFNSHTHREVYDDIISRSLKEYRDENEAHQKTQIELRETQQKAMEEKKKSDQIIEKLTNEIEQRNERDEQEIQNKIKFYGKICTILCVGIPYIAVSCVLEIFKEIYINFTDAENIAYYDVIWLVVVVLITIALSAGFKKGKKLCFGWVEKILRHKTGEVKGIAQVNKNWTQKSKN